MSIHQLGYFEDDYWRCSKLRKPKLSSKLKWSCFGENNGVVLQFWETNPLEKFKLDDRGCGIILSYHLGMFIATCRLETRGISEVSPWYHRWTRKSHLIFTSVTSVPNKGKADMWLLQCSCREFVELLKFLWQISLLFVNVKGGSNKLVSLEKSRNQSAFGLWGWIVALSFRW